MNNLKKREGFVPACLTRSEKPLVWQPRAISGKAVAHEINKEQRKKTFERFAQMHWCAADLLNILEIFAEGRTLAETFLALEDQGSVYFAKKSLINTCGFCGIDCPEDVSIIERAKDFAYKFPVTITPATLPADQQSLF